MHIGKIGSKTKIKVACSHEDLHATNSIANTLSHQNHHHRRYTIGVVV